jgi:hypothetical protein
MSDTPSSPAQVQASPSRWWPLSFVISALLASACLALSFLLVDAVVLALVSGVIGLAWASPYLLTLRSRREKTPDLLSQPGRISDAIFSSGGVWFLALVVLAAWSLLNSGSFILALLTVAAALVAWDIYSYLERAAQHEGVGGAPGRVHLRALGLALGGGLAVSGFGYALGNWLQFSLNLWFVVAIGLVLVFVFIRIARTVFT